MRRLIWWDNGVLGRWSGFRRCRTWGFAAGQGPTPRLKEEKWFDSTDRYM